ncbi:MAG: hypothetical protein IKT50_05560 [Clostridia bacterium]|nr:hypothetical protein [Clostridia bacterium]
MFRRNVRFAVLGALLIVLSFFALSCGQEVKPVGRWQTEISDEELGSLFLVYRFTEEGEIFLEQGGGDEVPFSIPFGTYSVSGEKMTIVSDGETREYTFSVAEDELILSPEGEEDMIFTRA